MKTPFPILVTFLLTAAIATAETPATAAAPVAAPANPAAVTAAPKNLLKPTAKVENWQFEQLEEAAGTIATADDALAITVTKVDGTEWHLQAFQPGLDLKEGQTYVVTFKARAAAKRAAQIYAGVNEDDYHPIGLDEVIDLAPAWHDFTFTFTADSVAAKNNRLGFSLGQEKGPVWLKDVTLTEKK
ncbi:MAG TPA: carbohydrate binding domain-containing protein [Opitutaceae bacterium]|nr:carbohydrate binding domain-containing protein [Opitutaceae bacterium]